jgi:5-methylcytosine-specific restriction endonuclease McrA
MNQHTVDPNQLLVCERPARSGPNIGNVAKGTWAGYVRHRRAGESPCLDCTEAATEYQQAWEQANQEKRAESKRAWNQANRERNAESWRSWYQANREKRAEYRRSNPEKGREATRRYREAHPEKVAASVRSWSQANPEKLRARDQRRRARKANALTIPFTSDQLTQRMALWGNRCWMCGGLFEHVDHVIPLALGGPHCLSNLRPACRACNLSKGAKLYGSV